MGLIATRTSQFHAMKRKRENNSEYYAVITADVVSSSSMANNYHRWINALSSYTEYLQKTFDNDLLLNIKIYRGDAFQTITKDITNALKFVILFRLVFLKKFLPLTTPKKTDLRIALGIGHALFDNDIFKGNGEAFYNSGLELDSMKSKPYRLRIRTPWDDINRELNVQCALFDALSYKWTMKQIDTMIEHWSGLNQKEAAKKLDITQSAVSLRLKAAGAWAIDDFINNYEQLISANIKK